MPTAADVNPDARRIQELMTLSTRDSSQMLYSPVRVALLRSTSR